MTYIKSIFHAEVAERIDGGDPIEIAIITHGLLIRRQILEEPDSEVSNDQGFSASFTLDTETGRLKQNRAWKDIDESPGSRNTCKARAGLKPSDYARCERRYPAAWDRLGRKSCI
jgi:hypothetical protein